MIRHFNRRALLLGGTAAGGALMLRDEPFSPVICGPGTLISSARAQPVTPRVRPSLATPEGKQMLALYGKAIGRMKQLPRHDPRNWYFQANIHGYPEGRPVNGRRRFESLGVLWTEREGEERGGSAIAAPPVNTTGRWPRSS